MILLDSSVLIDFFRKKNKSKTTFYRLLGSYQSFAISTVTYYEIGIGSKPEDLDFWNQMFRNFIIMPFDLEAAKTAIEIRNALKQTSYNLDFADLQIASIAISRNLPLSTLNVKHFKHVTGLQLLES